MGKKSKKGGKGSKGKGKKGKKAKPEVTLVVPEPVDSDTFIWVRRQSVSLLIETNEDCSVPELKLMVATILGKLPENIQLLRNGDEMVERKEIKEDPRKKEDSKSSLKSKGSKGSKKSKKSKKKSKKGSKKGKGSKKTEKKVEPEKLKEPTKKYQIFTVGDYDFNARTTSIFNPGTIGMSWRDTEGNFEPLDINPWTNPIQIPESVKPYLRNYAFTQQVEDAKDGKDKKKNA